MKKAEVKIGGKYYANVTGKKVEVQIDSEKNGGGWFATNLATGRLATFSAGASASECQVQVTLLGEITAMSSSVTLPLRWGPE